MLLATGRRHRVCSYRGRHLDRGVVTANNDWYRKGCKGYKMLISEHQAGPKPEIDRQDEYWRTDSGRTHPMGKGNKFLFCGPSKEPERRLNGVLLCFDTEAEAV